MPVPRLNYVPPIVWTPESVQQALVEDDPANLIRVVVSVALCGDDQKYAEALCV